MLDRKIHVKGGRKKNKLLATFNQVILATSESTSVESITETLLMNEENHDDVECRSPTSQLPLCDTNFSSLESN